MADELEFEYILSRYNNMKVLSESDNCTVTLAVETKTNKPAIKRKLCHNMGLDIYKQLHQTHLNGVPRIYHVLEGNECSYVFEEYVAGVSLESILETMGKQNISQVTLWVTELCKTLRKLHACVPPIIHRDIKPSNIMVMENGLLKLIDFNISRNYNSTSDTDTRALGTAYYAAPEQYGYAQTDARTDIYAVGKLMIELLTGVKRKPNNNLDACGYLAPIIIKCCAIDPANRYQNVSELLRVLQLTIFDGFAKMNTDELAAIIAVLDTMKMDKAVINQIQQVGKGICISQTVLLGS